MPGSTTCARRSGSHPDIAVPSKRVHRYTPLRYGRAVETALADYDRLFAAHEHHAPRYRLETSPGYFDGGRTLVETVNRELPGLRVIVVLRDPAERLWASYSDKLARGRLPEGFSFEGFVERGLALRANGCDRFESNRHFRTLASGHYVDHLATWLDVFGRRVHIAFAEDLEVAPAAGVAGLVDWLDLEPVGPPAGRRRPAGDAHHLGRREAALLRRRRRPAWVVHPGPTGGYLAPGRGGLGSAAGGAAVPAPPGGQDAGQGRGHVRPAQPRPGRDAARPGPDRPADLAHPGLTAQ